MSNISILPTLFIKNKYYIWYNNICKHAKERNWSKKTAPIYVEQHHIIPKSINDNHSKDNLIFCSAREHYLAHLLLTKCINPIYTNFNIKVILAFNRMKKSSSHEYQFFRENHSKKLSKSMSGVLHPRFGKPAWNKGQNKTNNKSLQKLSISMKGKSFDNEHCQKISIALKGKKRKPFTMDHRKNLSAANKGNKRPDTSIKFAKDWSFVDPFGKLVTFKNLRQFCLSNSLNYNCMKKVMNDKSKQHRGWTKSIQPQP